MQEEYNVTATTFDGHVVINRYHETEAGAWRDFDRCVDEYADVKVRLMKTVRWVIV